MSDVQSFLRNSSGSSHPAFKFNSIGDTLSGVISEEPKMIDQPNLNTGVLEPKLVVAITTDEGITFSLWVGKGFLAQAIGEASQAAGGDGTILVGGRLGVRFSGERDTGKPKKARLYEAEYVPPGVGGSILSPATSTPAV